MLQAVTHTLGTVEEMGSAFDGTPWSMDFRQLGHSSTGVRIAAIATPVSMLMHSRIGSRTHQLGALDARTITFGLPDRDQSAIRFGPTLTDSDTLTLFDNRAGFDAVSEADFGAYTLTLDTAHLESLADELDLDFDRAWFSNGMRHKPLPANGLTALRSQMNSVLCAGVERPGNAAIARSLQQDIAVSLLRAFSGSDSERGESRSARQRAVFRAREFMAANLDEVPAISEVCARASCSIATLERGFREYFGVSPKQYLSATRLSRARSALLQAPPGVAVGDIAAACGFWHMSKFAADYKRMFGELPSATLRRAGT